MSSEKPIIERIERGIAHQKKYPGDACYSPAGIKKLISMAKDEGADVSTYEAMMPEIEISAAMARLEEIVREHKRYPWEITYSPCFIQRLIDEAKKVIEGYPDVEEIKKKIAEYEARMPEFEMNYVVADLEHALEVQEAYPDTMFYPSSTLLEMMEKVKKLGGDVTKYEAQFLHIRSQEILRKQAKMKEAKKNKTT